MKDPIPQDPTHKSEHINFTIVKADDVEKLIELQQVINEDKDVDKLKDETKEYIDNPEKQAFFLKVGDEIVGYILVDLEGEGLPKGAPEDFDVSNLARVSKVGVSKEYSGKHLGEELLKEAENLAKKEGKDGMYLDYLASNEPAVKLYSRSGYEQKAEFTDPKKQKLRRIGIKRFKEETKEESKDDEIEERPDPKDIKE